MSMQKPQITDDQVSVHEVQMLLGEQLILAYVLRKRIAILEARLKELEQKPAESSAP